MDNITNWVANGVKIKELVVDEERSQLVFSCGQEIIILDMAELKLKERVSFQKEVDAFSISVSHNLIAIGLEGGCIEIRHLDNMALVHKFHAREPGFHSMAWSPNAKYLLVGLLEAEVLVVDTKNWKIQKRLKTAQFSDMSRNKVGFIPGKIAFFSVVYNSILSWNKKGTSYVEQTKYLLENNQYGQIQDWCVSPDTQQLAAISDNEQYWQLTKWEIQTGNIVAQKKLEDLSRRIAWSPDDKYIAIAEWYKITLLNSQTLETVPITFQTKQDYEPTALAFNHDSSILWFGTKTGHVFSEALYPI